MLFEIGCAHEDLIKVYNCIVQYCSNGILIIEYMIHIVDFLQYYWLIKSLILSRNSKKS